MALLLIFSWEAVCGFGHPHQQLAGANLVDRHNALQATDLVELDAEVPLKL
jgi:uncharacterized protein YmfQ (DUF2313 family)